ncbi:hypothetical protein [Ferruginibacter sp.]|nr:hypothetical protein [Ferruginibacter sp.]
MSIQIEINDIHVKQLTEFYIQRLKALREEIIEREKESKEINLMIQKLRKANIPEDGAVYIELPAFDYSDKWPWVKKIQFAIEYSGRALTTKEIVDTLSEFETSFIYDRKRAIASISSVLSMKSGNGKEFLRSESVSGDFAYDLNKGDLKQVSSNIQEAQAVDELPF